MVSFFPRYLDKTLSLQSGKSVGKPITEYESALFNWLSSKLVATQTEAQCGLAKLGTTLDVMGSSPAGTLESIKSIYDILIRRESFRQVQLSPAANLGNPSYVTLDLLFTHTTNGGSLSTPQRFVPSDGSIENEVILRSLNVRVTTTPHAAPSLVITDDIRYSRTGSHRGFGYTIEGMIITGANGTDSLPVPLLDANNYCYGFRVRMYRHLSPLWATTDPYVVEISGVAQQGIRHRGADTIAF
jgi:hypothetical protein